MDVQTVFLMQQISTLKEIICWPENKYSSDPIQGVKELLQEPKIMCTVLTLPALSPITTKDRLIELKSSRGREKQVLYIVSALQCGCVLHISSARELKVCVLSWEEHEQLTKLC